MYRYIKSSSSQKLFGKFLYHATKSREDALSIQRTGFRTNKAVYITDSIQYAREYGNYVVRFLSKDILGMNLVPMENYSVNPDDYDEDVQGVYEPVTYDPGKKSICVFDVKTLNSLISPKYLPYLGGSNVMLYQIWVNFNDDQLRRNDYSVGFEWASPGEMERKSIVYRFPDALKHENKDVPIGEAYDVSDMYKVIRDYCIKEYGEAPFGMGGHVWAGHVNEEGDFNPNKRVEVFRKVKFPNV